MNKFSLDSNIEMEGKNIKRKQSSCGKKGEKKNKLVDLLTTTAPVTTTTTTTTREYEFESDNANDETFQEGQRYLTPEDEAEIDAHRTEVVVNNNKKKTPKTKTKIGDVGLYIKDDAVYFKGRFSGKRTSVLELEFKSNHKNWIPKHCLDFMVYTSFEDGVVFVKFSFSNACVIEWDSVVLYKV